MIPEALQTKEEHVTKFRILFGTVGGNFEKVKSPVYMTYVSSDAKDVILNEIELTAEHHGKKLRDKDRTETILYRKTLSGYNPGGGGSPLYEIVETDQNITDSEISLVRRNILEGGTTGLEELEGEGVPKAGPLSRTGVQTGDDISLTFLLLLAVFALTGIVILWCFGRRKQG